MNALMTLTNDVAKCGQNAAPHIMAVCRAVTPQFYKTMSDVDVQMEKASIELLTVDIDNRTLAKMCELAVLNYPRARSENNKIFFDINYILTFYKQAFNFVWCESVDVPRGSERVSEIYHRDTKTIEEKYKDKQGNCYHIKQLVQPKDDTYDSRIYSSKFWEVTLTDIDDFVI